MVPKNFKVAKLFFIGPSNVNRVVGHGKCGYPGNLEGNCCIVVKLQAFVEMDNL